MRIDVLTLFPEMLKGFLENSIIKRAREAGLVEVNLHNFREYSTDKHNSVDDEPFGGGPGMVLTPGPVFRAVKSLREKMDVDSPLIFLTPKGERLTQPLCEELSKQPAFTLLCGRYEGLDQRVIDNLVDREISIGDYVLSGGEPAAAVVIDSVARLIPGALGDDESAREESFSWGMLEYPQYTRPADFNGWKVPDVLLSGHHEAVRQWRREKALELTRDRRPDLLENTGALEADYD